MKCNKIIERYLMLDKHQMIPFDITLHLLFCKKCRLEVVKLVAAEKTAAEILKTPEESSCGEVKAILEKARIEQMKKIVNQKSNFFPWILSGVIMVLCFAVFPMLSMGEWGVDVLGNAFVLAFFITAGFCVALYSGIFIATHLDFFIKKYDFKKVAR